MNAGSASAQLPAGSPVVSMHCAYLLDTQTSGRGRAAPTQVCTWNPIPHPPPHPSIQPSSQPAS
eukprot:360051-Chlamydomonas_euryale.AAC.3